MGDPPGDAPTIVGGGSAKTTMRTDKIPVTLHSTEAGKGFPRDDRAASAAESHNDLDCMRVSSTLITRNWRTEVHG